ncbi:Eco57I restriction-modification methylase domain-containing protein [Pontibacter sp. BAB1700]|uniref:Eco57I restriction-modification methylase domain-containing protein n=1 Tax=Pontibacter sp. BAB1700 TaxID=1144253 RepID=UPI00031B12EC|nr:Eco57I restriction-modification methylase domain-containing protein [Pontibacter sp. BAB1700]
MLGLIFEKINGYRDGSFYTPGFITMYMSREAIRRAVVQRFNEFYTWELADFDALRFRLMANHTQQSALEANQILNSLRICDPAVGSGHYLVSALNELIVIKAELRVLLNRQGKPLHYGSIEVQNDELIVTDYYGELFSYTVHQHPDGHRSINPQVQELQETLFHEKQTIIENCLFGVDINPNSVKICRLRLWIELLKNAYYCQNQDLQDFKINRISAESNSLNPKNSLRSESWKSSNPENPDSDKFTQLQTLPNIDINIKQGNSLLSRYPLTADLHEAFGKKGHSLQAYREAVGEYKHTNSKETKKRLVHFLEEIKQGFRTTLANNDPLRQRMAKLRGTIAAVQDPDLFGAVKVDKTKLAKMKKELQKLEAEREQIETNKVYEGAFEWRFEFPEVLDEQGNYRGFDVVIGNPPYIRQEELGDFKLYLKKHFATFAGTADLYVYFVERGIDLLREGGQFSYIVPNKWMRAGYGQALRGWVQTYTLQQLLDFGDLPVFEEATTYPLIVSVTKTAPAEEDYTLQAAGIDTLYFERGLSEYLQNNGYWVQANLLPESGWSLSDSTSQQLLEKLKNTGIPLGEYVEGKIYRGVLTGLNEAFVIDEATKDRLIAEDPRSAEVIKPFLAGRDVKRYMPPKSDKYLILFPAGFTKERAGNVNEEQAWKWLQENFSALANYLSLHEEKAKKRLIKVIFGGS